MSDLQRRPARTFPCRICGEKALTEIEAFRSLARVSSDVRPFTAQGRLCVCRACGALQGVPDAHWIQEIDTIYREFSIYHEGDGTEKVMYDLGGGGQPRSVRMIDHLIRTHGLPETGDLLEIGCGNGAALRAFGQMRPGWALWAAEVNDRDRTQLERIPGFRQLFIGEDISGNFDTLLLIHSLEHLIDPVGELSRLRHHLKPGGHLVVLVPDVTKNPFCLIVADHLLHFTPASLGRTAHRAGYGVQELANSVLPKELTLIGGAPGGANTGFDAAPPVEDTLAWTQATVAWLAGVIDQVKRIDSGGRPFGIFGTSISGLWLHTALPGKATFFVDEDPSRRSHTLDGLPILSPDEIPDGADVYVPLMTRQAQAVAERLAPLPVRFHIPAPTVAWE